MDDSSSSYSAGGSAFFDVGSIISNLFSTLTGSGGANPPERDGGNTHSSNSSGNTNDDAGSQASSSNTASGSQPINHRSGSASFGPVGFQWEASTTGSGAFAQTYHFRQDDNQQGNRHRGSSLEHLRVGEGSRGQEADDDTRQRDFTQTGQPPLPLATLQSLLSNLFNVPSDDAEPAAEDPIVALQGLIGSILGIPENGRMGDYVFGQHGLDNIITQMMEQTQGNGAPPPASADAIADLKRFKASDDGATKLARNRECPTCLDAILESTAPSSRRNSVGPPSRADNDEDDPPEVAPADPEASNDALILLPCKHAGHEACVVPWLQRNGTCPICRVSVQPSQDANDSPSQQTSVSDGNTAHHPTVSATMAGEFPDTDEEWDNEEQDTPQERLRRVREATERRVQAQRQQQQQSSMPGGFGAAPHSGGDPYGLD